jgi:diadenylate cyclase
MYEIIDLLKIVLYQNYFIIFRETLDLLIIIFISYYLVVFSRDTRFFQLIKALFIIILLYIIFYSLGLKTSIFIIEAIGILLFISIPIIFQYEIRRFLYNIGKQNIFSRNFSKGKDLFDFVNIIVNSVKNLSSKKIGALIIIQRNNILKDFIDTGIELDCIVSSEIIESIFYSGTPLHDGAIIINNNRIVAASVLLPLSENIKPTKGKYNLGTRHRAGLGMSEQTDAISIIVSEETGDISMAMNSKLYRHLEVDKLEKLLINSLQSNDTEEVMKSIKDDTDKTITLKSNKLFSIVFSIFLSLSLYFIVNISINRNSDFSEKIIILPIETKYHGKTDKNKNKIAIKPKYAKVKVVASKEVLDNINPENILIWVNLDGAENNQPVKINISTKIDNISIKEIIPKNVIVSF